MARYNPANVNLGPCSILYDDVDLGMTQGGVSIDITTKTKPFRVDHFGGGVQVDELITRRLVTVKVPLIESTIANLMEVAAGYGGDLEANQVGGQTGTISAGYGIDLAKSGRFLTIAPQMSEDTSGIWQFPLASWDGSLDFVYALDRERVFTVQFTVYPDANQTLFIVKDSSNQAFLLTEEGGVVLLESQIYGVGTE